MVHNRNKIITLFIGNLSNAILHSILEQAIHQEELTQRYHKESITSLTLAKAYRAKINPLDSSLPARNSTYIREKVLQKVTAELNLRISKGYQQINISLVPEFVDQALKDLNII